MAKSKKKGKKKKTDKKSVKKKTSSGAKAHLKRLQKAWEKADIAGGKAPEGTHQCRIEKFEIKEKDKNFRAVWQAKIQSDVGKGQMCFISCGLAEAQLPFLKGILSTLGLDFPRAMTDLETTGEEAVGMDVTVEVVHNGEYANSTFLSVEDDGTEEEKYDDEDEEEEDDAEEESSEEEEDEDDEDEEESSEEEEDEDDEDEDEDDEEEDEEEDDSSSSSGSIKKSDVNKMDEDELDEIIDEEDLDVDLDDFKGIRKQRTAVLKALEEEDLLSG